MPNHTFFTPCVDPITIGYNLVVDVCNPIELNFRPTTSTVRHCNTIVIA